MTSSTVGVESAIVLRKKLRARLLNHRDDDVSDEQDAVINSTLDQGSMPLFVGVGCFPPDPTDGAGQYNVVHGFRMSGVIKDKLPDLKLPRESTLVDKPFNKFFLVDGSGAWRTQDNKDDYSGWVARTLSTMLTCHSVDAEPGDDTFYDSIEMLDSCEPFSHVGLVMAGLKREEQDLLDSLRFAKEKAPQVFPESATLPNVSLLREIIGGLEGTDARELLQDVREAANRWQQALGIIPERLRWWQFWRLTWWLPWRWFKRDTAYTGSAARYLKQALSSAPERIDEYVNELNEEWEKKSHQGIWAMPMRASLWMTDPLQDSLPLRDTGNAGQDYNIIQDRNKSRQLTHDMVRMLMRHLIDPLTVHPVKIKHGTMMLVGSNNVKRDYPLPEPEDMTISFGGDWDVLMSEHIEEKNPMHLLLWWQPEDDHVLPLYYRADDSIALKDLPSEYAAWPDPSEQQPAGQAEAQDE